MSDRAHTDALADSEARRAGLDRSFTSGLGWRNIVLAFALILFVRYGVYRLAWPASYFGPVQWSNDYATIRLVDTSVTLDVSDMTDVSLDSHATLDYLRTRDSGREHPQFVAQVIYRPYLWPKGDGSASGSAQAIAER